MIFHQLLQERPLRVMTGTLLSSVLGTILRAVATGTLALCWLQRASWLAVFW